MGTAPLSGPALAAACLAAAALAIASILLAAPDAPDPLRYPDANDYAQMGRQLAVGSGFDSLQVFPYVLGWLDGRGSSSDAPWPNLWRFPLPVVTRALAMQGLGARDASARLPGVLYSAATAVLVLLLANRLAGRWAALPAVVACATAPSALHFAGSGLAESGAAFFIAWIALLLLRARAPGAGPGAALGLGAAIGLAWLQRANLVWLAPIVALLLLRSPTPHAAGLRIAALVSGAGAVAAPWLLRGALHFGSPGLSLTSERALVRGATGIDPFFSFEQFDVSALAASQLPTYLSLWSARWFADNALALFGSDLAWLLPASAVAAFLSWRSPLRPLWMLAFGGLIVTLALLSGVYPWVLRFYWPFAPLLVALTAAAAVRAGSATAALRGARLPALCGATAVVALVAAIAHGPTPLPRAAQDVRALAQHVPAGGWVASDVSHWVAWQAERPSVRFRGDPRQLVELEQRFRKVDAILLSLAPPAAFEAALAASGLAASFERVPFEAGALWVRRSAPPGLR